MADNSNTVVVEARVDLCDLATLWRYYEKESPQLTRSEVIRMAIGDLIEGLVESGLVRRVTTNDEARAVLPQKTRSAVMSRKNAGKRIALTEALSKLNAQKEGDADQDARVAEALRKLDGE